MNATTHQQSSANYLARWRLCWFKTYI